jgi:isopenicillin-N N-acyltransferase-like protein
MEQVRTFTSSALAPYDRGAEFGERHRTEVAVTVAAYRRLFAARAVRPFDTDLWAERAWQTIQDLVPAAAEEIRGIADGAELPVREVAALNARTELLAIANPTGASECSTVVSLSPERPPVAVQTWDWYDAMAGNWLHWTIPHPDGTVVETVTEYGVLGKVGVNSRGVGVLFNMLHHAHDGKEEVGYPLHLLARQILDTAHSLDEALVAAGSVRASASSSLTVVERGPGAGRAVSVEMFPDGGPGLLEPDDGLLVRTNHFVSDKGRPGCLADGIGPDTRVRRDTLLRELDGRAPASADEVVDAMHDHSADGAVCAHPDPAVDPVLQHATLATIVVDTDACRLEVTPGGPCVRPTGRT